ncbi:MAG: hypothetical protein JNL44_15555 [Gemmatimonadetes bacterium]|nr:hypothetical protein [Gemmatimonadota bacterium]
MQDIKFQRDSLSVTTYDGEEYEFQYERGYRWRTRHGWCSRSDVEDALGVWPGYVDAIEDLHRTVGHRIDELGELERRRREEHARMWEMAHESALSNLELGRHAQLRVWRSRNTNASQSAPSALAEVRHVKRLEVSQPCHVYFLVDHGEVVYVGQTAEPWPARILSHLKEGTKQFDDVWYLEVDRQSLLATEKVFIRRLRPRYNLAGLERGGRDSGDDDEESKLSVDPRSA